jgi:membrane protein
MSIKTVWQPVKDTWTDFTSDKATRLAAALAFYTIFSIGPMLLIVIAVAGAVWGREAVSGALVQQIGGLVGEDGGKQIETIIQHAHQSGSGTVATIVGIITLLIGATGLFAQLKDALNTVWEVQTTSRGGWWSIWFLVRDRLLSFAMLLVIAFLLLASLVVSAALSAMGTWMGDVLPLPVSVLQVVNVLVSFAVITLLFALIFKWLPDVKISWRDVWMGAAATSLLFSIGKFALGMYLGRSTLASVYGAAGSMIIILVWVYYAAVIFLLGAEFTQVYARQWGSRIEPKPGAELVSAPQRRNEGLESRKPLRGPPRGQPRTT